MAAQVVEAVRRTDGMAELNSSDDGEIPQLNANVDRQQAWAAGLGIGAIASMLGMLPLAFALGEGAEQRALMARAVIGGLITSTLLTLFVVPVVYSILDDAESWLRGRRRAPATRHRETVPALADANVQTPA